MMDGVEFVNGNNPTDWTNNKSLSFHSWVDNATGEYNKTHADINGLYLSIVNGKKNTYCNVRGSLIKYFTKGETNAIDYGFSDFITTCEQLQKDLHINPTTSILRGFEFGVNITLPFYCSIVFECIKSYKQYPYNNYVEKRQILGIVFKLQHYSIKIYDKGLQETGKKSQLLRFEIVVNKMLWVNRKKKLEENRLQLDIKTLADLQSKEVWAELSKELIIVWDKIVFVDKSLCRVLMSNHNQNKHLRYLNSHYWANLSNKQYCTDKKHLENLQSRYSVGEDKQELISNLITNKCSELLAKENTDKNGNELTELQPYKNAFEIPENLQRLENQKWEPINHLDKGLKALPNPPTFLIETDPENKPYNLTTEITGIKAENCECMNCKKTLKEKKVTAKFCTDKCRKAFHEREQTKANQKKQLGERERLEKVLNDLPKTNLSLLIMYKANGLKYADQLRQKEISVSSEWIKQIEKVLITGNKSEPPIEFTTLRAKKLIREIAKLNR